MTTKFASLDGAQETTPAGGTGSLFKGAGFLSFDNTTGRVAGFLVHNIPATTDAHVHVGARGVPGGVIVPLQPAATNSNVYVVADGATLPAANVADFLGGNLYFNVHTTAFPLGEIRGQIDMTPTAIKFASLDGAQETTPAGGTGSLGRGGGVLAFDSASNRIAGFLVHNLGPTTDAHIHVSSGRGVAGGVLVPLQPAATSSSVYVVADGATLLAANVADFTGGTLYYNVHTTAFPLGEIRGQIDRP